MTALPVLPAAAQRDLGRCGRFVISTEHRDLARPIKIEIAGDGLPDSSCNVHPTDAVDSSRGDKLPVCRVAPARSSLVSPQRRQSWWARWLPQGLMPIPGVPLLCFCSSADSSCALVSFTAGSYPRADPGRVVGVVPAAAHGDFTFLLGSYTWTAVDPNSMARAEDYEQCSDHTPVPKSCNSDESRANDFLNDIADYGSETVDGGESTPIPSGALEPNRRASPTRRLRVSARLITGEQES